jgi:hypothetical protein
MRDEVPGADCQPPRGHEKAFSGLANVEKPSALMLYHVEWSGRTGSLVTNHRSTLEHRAGDEATSTNEHSFRQATQFYSKCTRARDARQELPSESVRVPSQERPFYYVQHRCRPSATTFRLPSAAAYNDGSCCRLALAATCKQSSWLEFPPAHLPLSPPIIACPC